MKFSIKLIVILIIVGALATIFLLLRPFTPSQIIEDEGLLFEIGAGRKVYQLVEVPLCQPDDNPREIARRAPRKFVVRSNNIDLSNYRYQLVKVWGSLRKEKRKIEPPEIVCFKSPCFSFEEQLVMNANNVEISENKLSSCQEDYIKWTRGY
ncbi:hypothetical protein A3C25_05430 [Candidatus Roizmanbacteria bacterium RIFCSPHIGHO2_02_FULL_38_11]|uniref:Uncharacterized protein n=1 Tax=Candidatus Roizmanbacteria bacterium RIFCSPHIGHO2_02_FULL_38_11 TaxID=1802039 RepID=A0A1F7GYV7_9BACT|nr:MAG: hypothetical protein A3C25_05430 [Candidatus Roizmanbacteria bacterium RIFCSPHIGHO2_02_FULL_38_11]